MYDKTNSYAAALRSPTQINAMDSCPKDFLYRKLDAASNVSTNAESIWYLGKIEESRVGEKLEF